MIEGKLDYIKYTVEDFHQLQNLLFKQLRHLRQGVVLLLATTNQTRNIYLIKSLRISNLMSKVILGKIEIE